MYQRGFSTVAGVILGLVILSAVVVGGVLILNGAKQPKPPSSLTEISAFNHIEYAVVDNKLLVNDPGGFEGYRSGGMLIVADIKTGAITKIERVIGFSVLDNEMVLLAKTQPRDLEFCKKLAEEQGIGCGEIAPSAALYKLNLKNNAETPIGLNGGEGGIFRMSDGTIYVSGNAGSAYYLSPEVSKKYSTIFFGWKPYYRFDAKTQTLTKMPDDFVPNFFEVAQPKIVPSSETLTSIIEKDPFHFWGKNYKFYLQFD